MPVNHMQDWKAYSDALLGRVGEFAKLNPDSVRGLQTIENSARKTGKLDPKVNELVALAVAVPTRCDGCIARHAKAAIESHWGDIEGSDIALWALYPARRLLISCVPAFLAYLKEAFPNSSPDELAVYIGE